MLTLRLTCSSSSRAKNKPTTLHLSIVLLQMFRRSAHHHNPEVQKWVRKFFQTEKMKLYSCFCFINLKKAFWMNIFLPMEKKWWSFLQDWVPFGAFGLLSVSCPSSTKAGVTSGRAFPPFSPDPSHWVSLPARLSDWTRLPPWSSGSDSLQKHQC